jgi:hypothetical protein
VSRISNRVKPCQIYIKYIYIYHISHIINCEWVVPYSSGCVWLRTWSLPSGCPQSMQRCHSAFSMRGSVTWATSWWLEPTRQEETELSAVWHGTDTGLLPTVLSHKYIYIYYIHLSMSYQVQVISSGSVHSSNYAISWQADMDLSIFSCLVNAWYACQGIRLPRSTIRHLSMWGRRPWWAAPGSKVQLKSIEHIQTIPNG